MSAPLHVGVAHHLGWAIVVTATQDHAVADRRRVPLVADGLPVAPVHHEGGAHPMHSHGPLLDDAELAALVARVRTSTRATTAAALAQLAADVGQPIASVSLRAWPADFPDAIATQRLMPYESQADSVMYRQVLAELAVERGWVVHHFDASTVEAQARALLGAAADDVLLGPRRVLGPPWAKDHRIALAATVVAVHSGGED